jgi:hypothetical protein
MRGACHQFAKTGACTYGDACRFAHGAQQQGVGAAVTESDTPLLASVSQHHQHGHGSGHVKVKHVVFVSGLPICVRADAVRKALLALLQPLPWSGRRPVLRVGVTHENGCRGYAHVTCHGGAADLALCVAALDGKLGLDSATLAACEVTDKRDTLFPALTREQRLQLRLDDVAVFSCTDGDTAGRTAEVISLLLSLATTTSTSPCGSQQPHTPAIVDVCACAGGSALAFARHGGFRHVTAVELHAGRAADLAHNAAVCLPGSDAAQQFTVVHGDGTQPGAVAARSACDICQSMAVPAVFCDPPWPGGPAYSASACIPADGIALGDVALPQLAHSWLHALHVPLVALGTPLNYDDAALARFITACRPHDAPAADRVLPFRLAFGRRMLLLLLAPLWTDDDMMDGAASPRLDRRHFPTAQLDSYVAALRAWNAAHAEEHHPRFFDWEKDDWVPLSRWKGAKPVKEPLRA